MVAVGVSAELRTCRTCGIEKPLEQDFHNVGDRGKGYRNLDCKPCANAKARQWRRDHLEHARAYDRSRMDRWKTPEGRAKSREYGRQWRARNPNYRGPSYGRIYFRPTKEASRAHTAVETELRSGRWTRPTECERCGRGGRMIEAAHHDYAKLLEVEWLCRNCHRTEDAWNPKNGVKRA